MIVREVIRHAVFSRFACRGAIILTWFNVAVAASISSGTDAQSMTSWEFANGQTQGWHASKSWHRLEADDQCWHLDADRSMAAHIRRSGLVLLGPVIDPPQEVHVGDGIELLLRTSHSGLITLFFQERIGDTSAEFGLERAERRYLHSSVDYQTLLIRPRWNDGSKIVRLRLDGPMRGGSLEVKSIRFVRPLEHSDANSTPEWDFRKQVVCNRVIGERPPNSLRSTPEGLAIAVQDGPGRITLDDRAVDAESHPWVRFRMRTDAGPLGGFAFHPTNRGGDEAMQRYWATHEFVKWFQFPVRPDGNWHTYNIRLTDYDFPPIGDAAHRKRIRSGFTGKQRVFHLVPSHHPNAKSCIESVSFGSKPIGPACLVAEYIGSADAVIRAGRTGTLAIRLRNVGGMPATGLRVELSRDPDSTGFQLSSIRHIPESLEPDQTATLLLDGRAERAGKCQVNLAIYCDPACCDQDRLDLSTVLHIEPAIHLRSGEIPEPKPIRTQYSIGCYYFTGWSDLQHWPKLLPLAERRPALGFYDECTPEIADWDIKWAVEHGIDYFVVLWYDHNGQQKTRFIEDALLKAKFLHHIDFCVMWCNAQNPWWDWTEDDFVRITDYWIQNYFVHPQYKRDAAGRPIVWMLQGWNMLHHFGKEKAIRLMQDAETQARKAGFPGIHWVACQHGGRHMFADPANLTAAGFEEWTAYNINGHISYPMPVIPAADVVRHAPTIWKACQAKTILPVFCGWDSKWVGREFTSCYGFSPDLFGRHLTDAKSLLDQGAAEGLVVDCWNEWGEGEALAPHAEHGFRLLEQIPKIFAPHEPKRPAIVPEDVGLTVPQIQGLRDPTKE